MSEIVFIIGTSSGTSQALARQYTAQGAMIRLVARRVDMLHKFVQTLPVGIQSRCHYYAADVRSAEPMHDMINVFIATVGLPDVVTANTGISTGTDLRELDDLKAFATVMNANWMGVLNMFQPFVGPVLTRAKSGQPGGTFVGIVGVVGVRGLPGAAAYSASKSAVIELMESLHVEFDPLGLHVMTIAPDYIRTLTIEYNPYFMPFLMPVDRFTLKAVNAIHRGVRFTVLLWLMDMVAKLLHILPRRLRDSASAHAGHRPCNPEISS